MVVSAIASASVAGVVRCLALLVGVSFKKGYWLIPTISASRSLRGKLAASPFSLTQRLRYWGLWAGKLHLTKTEVEPPPSRQTLAANTIISLPLKWERSQIPPDRYTGAVYLTMEGREGRLSIPVDLSMRIGPAIPILVLLVGIVLGRLFKYMQEKGIPQSDALAEVYEVENMIAQVDQQDQEILSPMVNKVRNSVSQMDLETVNADLVKIKERLNCLTSLRKIEQQLEGMEQDTDVGGENGLLAKISEARNWIKFENDDKAKELLQQIQESLLQLSKVMMGADQQPYPSLTAAANEAAAAILAAAGQKTKSDRFAWLRRLLIAIAGVSNVQAMATLRDAVRVRQSQLLETLRVACNSCGVRLTHILVNYSAVRRTELPKSSGIASRTP